jgi:hypothetical protein
MPRTQYGLEMVKKSPCKKRQREKKQGLGKLGALSEILIGE